MIKHWFKSGEPWIWLNAGAVSASIVMVVGLIGLIAVRGLVHFWPIDVADITYLDRSGNESRIIGEITDTKLVPKQQLVDSGVTIDSSAEKIEQLLIKTGNRDITFKDFSWVTGPKIVTKNYPKDVVVFERRKRGNFYGFIDAYLVEGKEVAVGDEAWQRLLVNLKHAHELHAQKKIIEKYDIGTINYQLEKLRLTEKKYQLDNIQDPQLFDDLKVQETQLNNQFSELEQQLFQLNNEVQKDSVRMLLSDGGQVEVNLSTIIWAFKPNQMNIVEKMGHYIGKLWEFVSDEPREANTEGGIFPAIFGTVMMVIIMSIIVTPFGVIAAVYLKEYAKQGLLTKIIRIAVNNLAGVPSIVYGVFGLGFFVYALGGSIDKLFFPEVLPAPTFGTGGIFWAALTLALLTLPVVIVSTEEGLSRIPKNIREGSLALGATKAETLWRTVLPMASPAMMTGLILAIARAAGEVAPLMIVGVVKLAPSLPLDMNFPFVHLDRKFMHLGFHIYDVGFQSPNVEAARPLVYATALLLVMIIILLNLSAVRIRNRLREKYRALEH